jgi:hypothetical protein
MGGSLGSVLLAIAVWDALVAVPHALAAAAVLRAVLSRGQARVYAKGAAVAGALMLVTGWTAPDLLHIRLALFALTLGLWLGSLFGARLRLLFMDAGVLVLSIAGAVASRHIGA